MEKEKKEYIATVTKVVRDSLNLSTPIDLESLVEKLGGTLSFTNTIENDKEAKIEKKEDSFEIYIDKNKSETRKRFSIAHEIGHLFLHMGYLLNPKKWESTNDYVDSVYYRYGYNIEEHEANEFAAHLLMPNEEFQEVSQKNFNDASKKYDINKIASHFNVSEDAAFTKGKLMGLFEGY
ncbi:hypothetical protein CN621_16925 [Bacillus wiedmannii]|uniref:ImmA/IrrE family metallo-endopeptidase n=1 Tax=Bacillus wiedmannii TaxID=1890302 RepID=UPI000BF17A68|nr:ImmA/IrrE family metallo-endopeptidase [Bacillus wiedmannii]PEN00134.1 hypothetical protein CN621_16925 [Bacillus wiedmannii]